MLSDSVSLPRRSSHRGGGLELRFECRLGCLSRGEGEDTEKGYEHGRLGSFADVRKAILGHAGFEITVAGGNHGVVFCAKEMLRIEINENTTMERFVADGKNGWFDGRRNTNILVNPFGAS
jgi:hypothetical protein